MNSDFDKALEAAAEKYQEDDTTSPYAERHFKQGGKWVRDFTIAEIVQYVGNRWSLKTAHDIEQHFKYRGGRV